MARLAAQLLRMRAGEEGGKKDEAMTAGGDGEAQPTTDQEHVSAGSGAAPVQRRRALRKAWSVAPLVDDGYQALRGEMTDASAAAAAAGEDTDSKVRYSLMRRELELRRCLMSSAATKFCRYEWCYSPIDRLYFDTNEFEATLCQRCPILHQNRQRRVGLLRREWSRLRAEMGRMRRLSAKFLAQERHKLQRYRHAVHLLQAKRQVPHEFRDLFSYLQVIPQPFVSGDSVLAVHPNTRELEQGTIMGTADFTTTGSDGLASPSAFPSPDTDGATSVCRYFVHLSRPDAGGIASVVDTDVFPLTDTTDGRRLDVADTHLLEGYDAQDEAIGFLSEFSGRVNTCISALDVGCLAAMIRLLDRKERLLHTLRTINTEVAANNATDDAASAADGGGGSAAAAAAAASASAGAAASRAEMSDSFRQEYAWVVLQLEATNRALEPAMRALRRSDAPSAPQETTDTVAAGGAGAP
ncbi:unnamed protein product [Vitrella brassicaformis CCMP3155]|uniref:DIRP domain-containing protein n=2 Tax=Vitrella brassicaformis TaxID=1169539 RepID=A0A0G4ESX6_VITBC|nr:unnamed protein product [Vitrella brassicaformis CCMP3155]|eukprot:CEM00985.1 unnamed protein product [Vitrella brassicaformis CCMP3155]